MLRSDIVNAVKRIRAPRPLDEAIDLAIELLVKPGQRAANHWFAEANRDHNELVKVRDELAQYLSPENANVTNDDTIAMVRDLAQVARMSEQELPFDLPDGPIRTSLLATAEDLGLRVNHLDARRFVVITKAPLDAYELGTRHGELLARLERTKK